MQWERQDEYEQSLFSVLKYLDTKPSRGLIPNFMFIPLTETKLWDFFLRVQVVVVGNWWFIFQILLVISTVCAAQHQDSPTSGFVIWINVVSDSTMQPWKTMQNVNSLCGIGKWYAKQFWPNIRSAMVHWELESSTLFCVLSSDVSDCTLHEGGNVLASIGLFVCLSVSKITEKKLHWLEGNFQTLWVIEFFRWWSGRGGGREGDRVALDFTTI